MLNIVYILIIIMWKQINDFSNYEINENGEIKNIKTNKLIIGDNNSTGYPRVSLVDDHGNNKRFFRHRLVAMIFVDNPNHYDEVNHKDCNIKNYKSNNLEWCSKRQNELHSRIHGSKIYKPFLVIWNNNKQEVFNTKTELSNKINCSSVLVKYWLHKKSHTFDKYGIKEIKYINNLKA